PSGGARTISGNLATPLVDLNGADNVTINGQNSGGNSLTLANSNTGTTAGTSTIRFINGAQNNTVTNCNIQGSSTVAVGTAGGAVLFSTSPAVGTTIVGNNNNTISNNNIGPVGASLPVKAISGVGTTTNNNTINTANVIDGNNIFDFFGAGGVSVTGIDIRTGNTDWTIQNNRIYQTATRTFTTTALRYAGITLSGTTGANANWHTIKTNIIGFGAANGTGTTTITGSSNEFRGLDLPAASSGTVTNVQGNIISGINQTSSRASTTAASSPFIGIVFGTTSGVFNVGNLSGNFVGSLDGSSTIVVNATSTTASNAPVMGIYDFSLSSCNVSNNNIGAITINSGGTGTTVGFRGILVNTSSASTETINNNTIGGPTAAGAITDTQVGSYVMYGIQTALPAVSMTGNTVRNLVGSSNFPATVVSSGIIVNVSTAVTNTSTISRNTIHSLSNASGAAQTSIYAMDLTLPATTNIAVDGNVIERNLIHSISNTSTDNTSQMWGIVQRGSGTAGVPVRAIFKNNMIRLGVDKDGNSITSGLSIIGIRDIQGATGGAGTSVTNYYFNSVYIGGTGVASSSTTFAFNGSALTSTRNYVDNIFWNARSNASGAGKNYAISLAGTAPNPAGLTSNYNDLYVSGTGGFVGLFNAIDQTMLADWQTATGQDANSISADPQFAAPNAAAAAVNLHILITSPARLVGTPIAAVTNDFDNDLRPAVTPDMGADQTFPATAAHGEVSGTITDAFGVPVAGVTISLDGTDSRETISDSRGNYRFDNVQANGFYGLTPVMANYHFNPANRWFSLVGNRTDAFFVAIADATATANAIDSNAYFVRQQYLDFLGREPEPDGLAFWTGKLNTCNGDAACLRNARIDVSAAFFKSQEFYDTGSFVYRLYRGALGRRLNYTEFAADRAQVVGGPNLELSKRAFAAAFVARSEFAQRYAADTSADSFVDALLQTMRQETGVDLNSQRSSLIAHYQEGGSMNNSRALVVRDLIDQEAFAQAVYNASFVEMEYMGYLRRRGEQSGYDFWVGVLTAAIAITIAAWFAHSLLRLSTNG